MNKFPIVLILVGGIFVVLATVIGFVVLPNVVDSTIEKELQLVIGTDVWNRWAEIESPVYMNFYIYNVTNPDEVEAGLPPNLQELGPYAYRQRRQKIDPHSDSCKETVKYEQKITYFFDQEASGTNREDDVVNIVNVPFVSLIKVLIDMYTQAVDPGTAIGVARYVAELLQKTERVIKRNVTVGDVTFNGFDVKEYNVYPIGDIIKDFEEFSDFRFGIYKGRNESTDGHYEVYTGAAGVDKFGEIKAWNGNSSLSFWNGEECNQLSGSDGSIFPPFLTKKTSITIFNSDLCRTLRLDFKEEVSVKDISAYRFSPNPYVLQNPDINPANECFCLRENRTECQSGIIDISPCRRGAPIILSTPHFLDGYEPFAAAMGLVPNRTAHETTIDLEPRTGMLLDAHKRIQINLEVRPLNGSLQYENITENMIFPVLWIDESASICDYDVNDFKSRVEKPIKAINIGSWVFIGIGAAMIFGALVFFFI